MPRNHAIPDRTRRAALLAAAIPLGSGFVALLAASWVVRLFPAGRTHLDSPLLWFFFLLFCALLSGLAAGMALRFLRTRVDRPVAELIFRARSFSMGKETASATRIGPDALAELGQALREMEEAAARRVRFAERGRKELERLFDVVPCYISVLDRSFRIIRSNRLFRKDFGRLEGRHCHEVFKNRTDPCTGCAAQTTFQDGQVHSREEEVITQDGRTVSLIVYAAPIKDAEGRVVAVMEMSTNITEVKQLQQALEAERKKHEQLFNIVPCYISIQNRDYDVLETNELFRRDFGDLRGHKCYRVYKGAEDICPDCPVQRTFEDGQTHFSEEVVITQEGKEANVVVYATPIRDEAGTIRAVMEMSTNITEIKRLQRELTLMGQTMAGMAHSIKNILMGLEGGVFVVSTAMEQNDDALLAEGWGMVQRNVEKVSKLVKDLLYCAKQREPDFREADPLALVRDVCALFREKAREDAIELRVELPDALPQAELDAGSVHDLLGNLVSNAIDACKFDLDKREHRIRVRAASHGDDHFELEVSDNGPGIPEELNGKVFDELFSTKGSKGTGLGLLMARKTVEEHGGEIRFDSTPGQGTTFRVILPLRPPRAGDAPPRALHGP